MKGIKTACAAFGLLFCLLATPSISLAAEDNPIDCSNGCEIVTCNSTGDCIVWSCDAEGCEIVGSYFRYKKDKNGKKEHSQVRGGPASDSDPAFSKVCSVTEPCAFKTCRDGKCEVSIFDGVEFVPAAVIDDVNAVIRDAQRAVPRQAGHER